MTRTTNARIAGFTSDHLREVYVAQPGEATVALRLIIHIMLEQALP